MIRPRAALAACSLFALATPAFSQSSDPLPPPTLPSAPAPGRDAPLPPAFGQLAPPLPATKSQADATDALKQAGEAFRQAKADPRKYREARDLFDRAARSHAAMTADQTAAWAYCRVKVAADRLNTTTDAATAADVAAEVTDALAAVPEHAALNDAARDVLAAAKKRAGRSAPSSAPAVVRGAAPPTAAVEEAGWQVVDGESVRVKHRGDREMAERIARTADALRMDVFKKWSGPPGGNWKPKCDIVLHPDSAAFTTATRLPPAATGRSDVAFDRGAPSSRRIDLRADDDSILSATLPRELTHVVLADLFPTQPPPRWAELGMAVLSESETEIARYGQTVRRCGTNGELMTAEALLTATEVPAKNVTGYHVQSVTLVQHLVGKGGEKAFTAFVRDGQRYGVEAALVRQYGIKDPRKLDEIWK